MQLGCERAVPEGFILQEQEGCCCGCSYRCSCRPDADQGCSDLPWKPVPHPNPPGSMHLAPSYAPACPELPRGAQLLFISFKLSAIAAALLSENPFVNISSSALEGI